MSRSNTVRHELLIIALDNESAPESPIELFVGENNTITDNLFHFWSVPNSIQRGMNYPSATMKKKKLLNHQNCCCMIEQKITN